MKKPINLAIKEAMKFKHVTQAQLAERIGANYQTVVSARLQRTNMKMDNVLEMLEGLGYEMVIQPQRAGRRAEGQIVVSNIKEEEE